MTIFLRRKNIVFKAMQVMYEGVILQIDLIFRHELLQIYLFYD